MLLLCVSYSKMELFENEWRAYYLKFMFEEVRPRCNNFDGSREDTDLYIHHKDIRRRSNNSSFLREMSKNPNITLDFIFNTHPIGYEGFSNPRDKWDWKEISANPAITMDDVETHSYLQWDFNRLCENPNMTLHMFKQIDEKTLDCRHILQNPFLGEKKKFIGCKMIPINVMVINEQLNDFSTYNPNKPWNNAQKVFADILIVAVMTKY